MKTKSVNAAQRRNYHKNCKKSRDVSGTMCAVMMPLVSQKTRLKTEGLFDPSEVCAYRGQTVYCATELCLSVDKRKKTTNKGRNDVDVQCPCNVTFCHVLKLGILTLRLNCRRLLKSCQLSTSLSSYR